MTNLSDWRAGRSLKVTAFVAALVATCIAAAVSPVADMPFAHSMIGFAVLMTWSAAALGLTALFLNTQTRGNHLYAQAILTVGYGFAALTMVPYMSITSGMLGDFPARLGMRPYGTQWLFIVWHLWLLAGIVGYHFVNWSHPPGVYWPGGRRFVKRVCNAGAVALFLSLVVGLWWPLPPLELGRHLTHETRYVIIPALGFFAFLAMLMPLYKRRLGVVLDLCLSLVCLSTVLELYLSALGETHFSVGWYLSRCYVVVSAMAVICVLLWQSAKMYQDLSRRARRFQDEALRDKLTGLANRRRFDDTIVELVAQMERRGDRLALAFVDIDRFKRFNDLHGHLAGDACLQRVANAISATLRPGDFVARYGGEEFVVVLDDTDAITAARMFERVRVAVAETSATPQHPSVTISIGVTMLRENDDVVKLVGRADTALYGAKSAGRNRVVFTDDLYRALAAS